MSGKSSANANAPAIHALVHEVRTTIESFSTWNDHAALVTFILDGMDLSLANQTAWVAADAPHDCELRSVIDEMRPGLSGLAEALRKALPYLQWRVDKGTYYEANADVGKGYRDGNMHCELIGPNGSAYHHDDFTLGLFFLRPHVLYRDHAHRAPELYLTLMDPSGWRFNGGEWQDVPSGTVIWNAPDVAHATRVYETPFFSVYSWTRDIKSKCRVVLRDDWLEIERALGTSQDNVQNLSHICSAWWFLSE